VSAVFQGPSWKSRTYFDEGEVATMKATQQRMLGYTGGPRKDQVEMGLRYWCARRYDERSKASPI
jgi:hypothetical protein